MELDKFSPHLFWDVDVNKIDPSKNKRWFINRILEYGLINDWKLLINYYGLNEISNIAIQIKSLDHKTASLIATLSGMSKEKFLCYSTQQLTTNFWNF